MFSPKKEEKKGKRWLTVVHSCKSLARIYQLDHWGIFIEPLGDIQGRTVSGGCMAMQTQIPETELAARNVQKLSAGMPADETR